MQYGIGSDAQYGISGYYPNAGFGAGNLDYGSGYDQYNNYPAGYNDYRERSYGKIPLSGSGYAAYPLNGNGGYGGYGGNGGLTSYSGYDGYYNGYDDTLPGNLGYGYFKQKNYPITYRKDYNSDPYYVYSQYPSSIGTGYVTGYRGYSKWEIVFIFCYVNWIKIYFFFCNLKDFLVN